MLLESHYQNQLIQKIKKRFPGCFVLKNDPTYIQGFPDLLILFEDRWATLETKRSKDARKGRNQEYYVDECNKMSYSSFVYPENEEEVMRELQQALQPDW
jgi:hypothetical protein